MMKVEESTVESAALAWLESLGWEVKHGSEIAPGGTFAEREDYREVVLKQRLRDALTRLNPALPSEALEEAFRRITNPEGATLEARNRAFHRMLTNGVLWSTAAPMAPSLGARCGCSISNIPKTTIGSRLTSSPSSKTDTTAAQISCFS